VTDPAAIFVPDGSQLAPTELARGPWDPAAQHGGAPAALMARALEGEVGGLTLARMTFEFLRPVPLEPLTVSARVVRPGRRARWIEATVEAGGEQVCRALGVALRREEDSTPEVAGADGALPGPDGVPNTGSPPNSVSPQFGGDGMEVRFVRGSLPETGPGAAWFRLRVPLVAGEQPSPAQRAAAAADFGNGISSAVDWDTYVFINPDLTVHLVREPRGEWVGLDSQTVVGSNGAGLSESVLHDGDGPIGRAIQALVVAPRQ
jgi:hypothetical protein